MNAIELALDQISDSDMNARSVASSEQADAGLMSSINIIGLLEPVLVAPTLLPDKYMLVAGRRRLAACRALGYETIPAVIVEPPEDGDGSEDTAEAFYRAASAAENLVRSGMHPVDQWMAVSAQVERGRTIEDACMALGIADGLARRFHHLAKMHPDVLAALASDPALPPAEVLRTIASAPLDVQAKAIHASTANSRTGGIEWWKVKGACEMKRIPRTRAEFDTTKDTSITWEEDLFAEPDDEDRWTTTSIDAFLARQQEHLEAEIAKSKGRIVQAAFDHTRHEIKLEPGFQRIWGEIPKRFPKDSDAKVFACVIPDGYRAGTIDRVMGHKVMNVGSRPKANKAAAEKPAITKAAMDRIASAKDEGVRERIDPFAANGARDMLQALLLYCCFTDIKPADRHRIGRTLIDENGEPRPVATDVLCGLAAELIADRIKFASPNRFSNNGDAAEWLAVVMGAHVTRVDDPDTLRGIGGDILRDIATAQGVSTSGTVSALRKRLAGTLPDWEPVPYGAKGPRAIGDEPPAEDAEDEDEDEDGEGAAEPEDDGDVAEDEGVDEDAVSAD